MRIKSIEKKINIKRKEAKILYKLLLINNKIKKTTGSNEKIKIVKIKKKLYT